MITKWKLCNFKSIRDQEELVLKPLTILVGPNSSGKSTLTQSILLVSQTLSSRVSSRSVVLNGNIVRLGQFSDLVSFGSGSGRILLGWECEPKGGERDAALSDDIGLLMPQTLFYRRTTQSLKAVRCEITFDVDPLDPQHELMQLQPRLYRSSIGCKFTNEDGAEEQSNIVMARSQDYTDKVQRLSTSDSDTDTVRSGLLYDIELDDASQRELRRNFISAEPVGCIFRHFLPDRLAIRRNDAHVESHLIALAVCDLSRAYPRSRYNLLPGRQIVIPSSVLAELRRILGEPISPLFQTMEQRASLLNAPMSWTVQEWQERVSHLSAPERLRLRQQIQEKESTIFNRIRQIVVAEKGERYSLVPAPLPTAIVHAVRYLVEYFSGSVKYLGPLRDDPKPLYPLSATVDPTDIGLRGEYTAAVLNLHREREIEYMPTARFRGPVDARPRRCSLEEAVLDWLHYMGVAEKVETHDKGKLGHELKVTTIGTDKSQDLTHVGVGVSQVLPILVMCLLAERDNILIVEQPELHLHPKVQTLLADFFLSMSMLGKQCIIETHSEYLINRLRYRVALAVAESVASLMKIYFVEKKNGSSVFRDVIINKYGAVVEWPEGFFDQSQAEAEEILRAASLKRKRERGAQHDAQRHY